MSVWRRTRTEVAGAWRSVRYDMGRRPFEPPADGPDVTSTGMNTFGGAAWDGPEPTEMPIAGRMPAPRRHPRSTGRAVVVSALGLLTVVGAAGAYLVVVNGLVPMRDEGAAAAGTLPPAAATSTAEAQIGRSPQTPRTAVAKRRPAPVINATPVEREPVVAVPRAPEKASPIRTKKPTNPICCVDPPVPTPTAPTSSPSPTPSATTSPSPSAATSDNPSESPEPRNSRKPDHHRRPH
jgi:hypothetical protein